MPTLKDGMTGDSVVALQDALRTKGFAPGYSDGIFGPGTAAAVMAFQRSEGLVADGIVGPVTAHALGLEATPPRPPAMPEITVAMAAHMFPGAHLGNIDKYLPPVLGELAKRGLTSPPVVLATLATIRAETAGFVPISEGISRYNTSPHGEPFDLYDFRKDLGNNAQGDGARYKGRGFVQLTGRANYQRMAVTLGVPLVDQPERANDPDTAAAILAAFVETIHTRLKQALAEDDLARARRLVNGGSHGLAAFTEAYRTGQRLLAGA